jgi:hypothetical protein
MKQMSLYNREVNPFIQAAIAVVIQALALVVVKLVGKSGDGVDDPVLYWEVVFTILLTYMLFNAMLSFPYKMRGQYFMRSLISFVIVAVTGGLLANFFSGITMDEAGSFRWLYLLLTFCYLVFLSIANAIWKIIEMAKKQDSRLRGED